MGVQSARFFAESISKPLHLTNCHLYMRSGMDHAFPIFPCFDKVIKPVLGSFPRFCPQLSFEQGCGVPPKIEGGGGVPANETALYYGIPQSPPAAATAPFNKGAFGGGPGPSSTQAPLAKGGCPRRGRGDSVYRKSVGRDDPGAPFSGNIRSLAAGGFRQTQRLKVKEPPSHSLPYTRNFKNRN